MSERTNYSTRTIVGRAIGVLLLAASAAACDRCGDFVPPIQFLGGQQQPEACRDQAPQPR
jgi:hypothetical protein